MITKSELLNKTELIAEKQQQVVTKFNKMKSIIPELNDDLSSDIDTLIKTGKSLSTMKRHIASLVDESLETKNENADKNAVRKRMMSKLNTWEDFTKKVETKLLKLLNDKKATFSNEESLILAEQQKYNALYSAIQQNMTLRGKYEKYLSDNALSQVIKKAKAHDKQFDGLIDSVENEILNTGEKVKGYQRATDILQLYYNDQTKYKATVEARSSELVTLHQQYQSTLSEKNELLEEAIKIIQKTKNTQLDNILKIDKYNDGSLAAIEKMIEAKIAILQNKKYIKLNRKKINDLSKVLKSAYQMCHLDVVFLKELITQYHVKTDKIKNLYQEDVHILEQKLTTIDSSIETLIKKYEKWVANGLVSENIDELITKRDALCKDNNASGHEKLNFLNNKIKKYVSLRHEFVDVLKKREVVACTKAKELIEEIKEQKNNMMSEFKKSLDEYKLSFKESGLVQEIGSLSNLNLYEIDNSDLNNIDYLINKKKELNENNLLITNKINKFKENHLRHHDVAKDFISKPMLGKIKNINEIIAISNYKQSFYNYLSENLEFIDENLVDEFLQTHKDETDDCRRLKDQVYLVKTLKRQNILNVDFVKEKKYLVCFKLLSEEQHKFIPTIFRDEVLNAMLCLNKTLDDKSIQKLIDDKHLCEIIIEQHAINSKYLDKIIETDARSTLATKLLFSSDIIKNLLLGLKKESSSCVPGILFLINTDDNLKFLLENENYSNANIFILKKLFKHVFNTSGDHDLTNEIDFKIYFESESMIPYKKLIDMLYIANTNPHCQFEKMVAVLEKIDYYISKVTENDEIRKKLDKFYDKITPMIFTDESIDTKQDKVIELAKKEFTKGPGVPKFVIDFLNFIADTFSKFMPKSVASKIGPRFFSRGELDIPQRISEEFSSENNPSKTHKS